MPLRGEKESSRSRKHHADIPNGHGSASKGSMFSLRNIGLGMLVVFLICSWQVILLFHHTDPASDARSATVGLWHHLSVHEANLTAIALQQREFAKLLGQLNTAVLEQQKELHDVERTLVAEKQRVVNGRDNEEQRRQTEEQLQAQRERMLALQEEIEALKKRASEQTLAAKTSFDTKVPEKPAVAASALRGAEQQEAPRTPKPVTRTADGKRALPAEWLEHFSAGELAASAQEAEKWRVMAKNAAAHAWKGYKDRAWGADEMKPVTGTQGRVWCRCGLQILDALSTLWIMDLKEQFDEGAKWVDERLRFDHTQPVSFFEITIRALGGLASAHSLSGRQIFLTKAIELANRMLPGFNPGTGFPSTQVNLQTGTGMRGWFQGTVLAEAGTVQLEFRYISQQTGDPKYAEAADKAMRSIIHAEAGKGLVPWGLSATAPVRSTNNHITFGAMGDSYYEYLLKMFLQTGSTEPEWKDAWKRAMDKMMQRLIFQTRGGLTYIAEEKGGNPDHKMDHLACFVGGMLIYGARELPKSDVDSRWETTAAGITETCYQMYNRQPSNLAPEASSLIRGGNQGQDMSVWNNAGHYLLRPEAAEAIFYMFYYTGDPKYRRMAGKIMEAIERHTKVAFGYSAVGDVRRSPPSHRNEMETFFMAETLKYLYLTFLPDPREVLDFDEFVLTTEAHPLRIHRSNKQASR
eukprot:TRINITY_DN19516_c0_g2_i1.p1 TRINITY_DN19516_c0_g2~~TRINITY_DN19516_c0_g2_i1.p1  ORF type:complete len:700 (+),score=129.99 TRINITY_DN19516_c0_g2_i1:24-2102(+)